MKIEKTSRKSNIGFISLSLFIILVLVFLVGFFAMQKNDDDVPSSNNPDDRNYIATTGFDVKNLIDDKKHLYNDSDVSIFALVDEDKSKLAFVYKEKPIGKQRTDMFFIHIFLKDTSLIKSEFFNITYSEKEDPEKITMDGSDYYVFKKTLSSDVFKEAYVPFNEIDYLNVGRFSAGVGRSLDANKIKVPSEKIISFLKKVSLQDAVSNKEYKVNRIDIYTKKNSFYQIKVKREAALKTGILLTNDDDYIKGEISLNSGVTINTDFRLKGDWTDHLNGKDKWSYRVIIKEGKTVLGMRKFSLQHPKTRHFQWEWLFNKVIKDEDIIGLRYEFVNFNIHVEGENAITNGIMALEESFDKILIENNKKREGIILGFDEDLFWKDKEQLVRLGLGQAALDYYGPSSFKNATIKVYNENKVLSDPKLSKQLFVAKDLLEGLRDGKYKLSEVFDIDKLTTYVAIANLFGCDHALVWHNLRIYFNPITNKLEPVSFDSNPGLKKTEIKHYPFYEGDEIYKENLAKKLSHYSSQKYLNSIINKYGGELNSVSKLIKDAYGYFNFNPSILEYNSNFIKKTVYPSEIIISGLIEHSKKELKIEVTNITQFPVEIRSLNHKDGKRLDMLPESLIIPEYATLVVAIPLKEAFNNAFVSKKNQKGGFQYPNDIGDLRLEAQIINTDFPRAYAINSFGNSQDINASIALYKKIKQANYVHLPFVAIDSLNKAILFKSGTYATAETLNFPAGYTITIEPGFMLDLSSNASFISKSRIIAEGTQTNPISFTSTSNTGGGLFITDVDQESILNYCIFSNLSNPNNELWEVSGAVNFHESDVTITNSQFKNNRCEDALNIIRSEFTLQDSQFYDTFSDSFDGDFVSGLIKNCQFYNSGNDGVDVSGSQLILENVLIQNPSDKGISAGEASTMSGNNITVENGEIGIVSKDFSTISFTDVTLNNTRLGFSAFQKKPEYGTASITINRISQLNNETNYLIERESRLIIDDILMPTVSNKVIDQMYGNEYGKSSK
jgi:hypothetical protein